MTQRNGYDRGKWNRDMEGGEKVGYDVRVSQGGKGKWVEGGSRENVFGVGDRGVNSCFKTQKKKKKKEATGETKVHRGGTECARNFNPRRRGPTRAGNANQVEGGLQSKRKTKRREKRDPTLRIRKKIGGKVRQRSSTRERTWGAKKKAGNISGEKKGPVGRGVVSTSGNSGAM